MKNSDILDNLLTEVRLACKSHPKMQNFALFPDEVSTNQIDPWPLPCSELLQSEAGFSDSRYADLRNSIIAAAPLVRWRETYKSAEVSEDFLDRFGCFTVLGHDGPFCSQGVQAWVVYMPPNLFYPWHSHPASEIYLVISGQAVFSSKGVQDRRLFSGDTTVHSSNQPHAMQTGDCPVLCLALWCDAEAQLPLSGPRRC